MFSRNLQSFPQLTLFLIEYSSPLLSRVFPSLWKAPESNFSNGRQQPIDKGIPEKQEKTRYVPLYSTSTQAILISLSFLNLTFMLLLYIPYLGCITISACEQIRPFVDLERTKYRALPLFHIIYRMTDDCQYSLAHSFPIPLLWM